MFNFITLLAEEAATTSKFPSWAIWVILGVMLVGMMALTIIPNKRKQKEYQKMQDEIRVGTRIMTIGRLIGTVVRKYDNDTLEVDIGTPGNPVVITINREAIGINLDAQEAARKAAADRAAAKAGKPAQQEVAPLDDNAQATEEVIASEESAIAELNEAPKEEPAEPKKKEKKEDDAI